MEIDIIIDTEYRLVSGTITKQDANELKAQGWKFDKFGEEMPDGRLTAPSGGKIYRLREAILLSKKLGRPLTQEEMRQFEV